MEELRHHRPGMLKDLIPETDNLEMRGNSVFATFRYITPVNEFNIPQREELILGAVKAAHGKLDWEGIHDDHHLAWPKGNYLSLYSDDDPLGRRYRALRSLRFLGPRQLHEYLHVGFSVPKLPDNDVMNQYILEEDQQRSLYSLLQFSSEEREVCTIDNRQELARRARYLARLEQLKPGEVGHMPDLDYLASLEISQARIEIGHRIRYLTFHDVLKTLS